MKLFLKIPVLVCLLTGLTGSASAQPAVIPAMPTYQELPAAQLDQLLGPIALYPDPLIAQMLPASTLPGQVVLASRFITGGGDSGQITQQPWDASVQAMAQYPQVLKYMDDNLTWTTQLGQAFLNQQADVMVAIQRLRTRAEKLGNLQSSPQQAVTTDGDEIEIVPADPAVMYVPYYQPNQVYDDPADGGSYLTYGIGYPIGPWLDYDFDWGNGDLIFWGRDHPRPANWWHERASQRDRGNTSVWRPDNHPGAVAGNRGDRGWSGTEVPRTTSPAVVRQELAYPEAQHAAQPAERSAGVTHSAAAPAQRSAYAPTEHAAIPSERAAAPSERVASVPVQRAAPSYRPESSSAFEGGESSQETRSYSNRGQQSRQAPAARSAPSGGGGGGGGGNRRR